ncbi:MAG: hypothetical protein KA945_14140 [Zoogloea sp.]|nr:hypothetical protein [Zoogloea sp.]
MWVATGARPHLRARMEAGTISRRGKHFALGGLCAGGGRRVHRQPAGIAR